MYTLLFKVGLSNVNVGHLPSLCNVTKMGGIPNLTLDEQKGIKP